MDLTFRGTDPASPEPAVLREQPGPFPPPRDQVVATAAGTRLRWAVGVVLFLGVATRFATRSHLWLDEALTLNIAQLPLGDLFDALRQDGAPPLYYVLLHAWTAVFGTSTLAVRILPGLFGVAALPLMWLAARRLGGTRMAWTTLVLLASSPFAVRYSTEARMYSLVIALVLVAFLAVLRLLDGGGLRPAVLLGLATGLLLLTHYWSFYLLATVGGFLFLASRRGPERVRAGARRSLVAVAAGSLLFLPWAPTFLYQLQHTGTPWGRPGELRSFFDTVTHFAGGYWNAGIPLGLVYFGLAVLAVFAWAVDGRRVLLDLHPRSPGWWIATLTFGTLTVAIVAGKLGHSAFAVRYASILFPLFLLLVGLGTEAFVGRRAHFALVAVCVGLGVWANVPNIVGDRTNAARVASALERRASPGDVVVYCPDQLGPSVSRELDADGLVQITFPRAGSPERIDWVDYEKVNKAARTTDYARMLLDRAGPSQDIWIVWAPGYRTFGTKCQNLIEVLSEARPDNERVVKVSTKYFERPGLVRFRAGTAG